MPCLRLIRLHITNHKIDINHNRPPNTPGFHRAFEEAVGRLRRQGKGGGGGGGGAEAGAARLPSEALIDVFRTLGQRPTATEVRTGLKRSTFELIDSVTPPGNQLITIANPL